MLRSRLLRASGSEAGLVGFATHTDASDDSWSMDISSVQLQAGDLGILIACADNNSGDHITVSSPSFVQERAVDSQYVRATAYVRTLNGTETTISGSSTGGANNAAFLFVVFRGFSWAEDNETPLNNENGWSDNPASVSAAAGDIVLIVGMTNHASQSPVTKPSGYVEVRPMLVFNYINMWAAYTETPSTPTEDPPSLQMSGTYGAATFTARLTPN